MTATGRRSKIALALAGGGPVGGIYEVGAMAALAEALEGVDFTTFDIYVGVSSGALLSAFSGRQRAWPRGAGQDARGRR